MLPAISYHLTGFLCVFLGGFVGAIVGHEFGTGQLVPTVFGRLAGAFLVREHSGEERKQKGRER